MPATHCSANTRHTLAEQRRPTRAGRRPSPAGTCSARGSPATRRSATVASLPNTRAATWLTDSHSTGLTLPGMIDEPACSSGSSSSASPADGPLASRRMSLAIFVSATAMPRSPADASASAPCPPWWTIGLARRPQRQPGLGGERGDRPPAANAGGALMPVPTAVPPSGSSPSASTSARDRRERPLEQPGPRVGLLAERHRRGVHQVGAPGLDDVGEALGRASRSASTSASTAGWTSSTSWRATARRIAVGTVSFDDCDALTWSFGCTGAPERLRRPAWRCTSLTFMFVDVPGPGLVHVDRELVVELAGLDPPGRVADRRGHLVVDAGHAERGVDDRGVALDRRQGVGDADVERAVGDREVADRQVGLLAPERSSVHALTLRTPARRATVAYIAVAWPPRPRPARPLRRRAVRPRRRAHADRRHPPAGVDEDVRRVPRRRRGQPPFTEDDYLAYVDGKPRFDGVRSFLASRGIDAARGRPDDPPGDGHGVGARQPQERACSTSVLRDEGIAPYPGSLRLLDHLGRRGHAGGRRVVVAQRPRGARGRRPGAALRRRRRRRRRRRASTSPASRRPTCSSHAADRLGVDAGATPSSSRTPCPASPPAGPGGFGLVVGVDRGAGPEALPRPRRRRRRRRPRRARWTSAPMRRRRPGPPRPAPLPDRPVAARRAGVRRSTTSA